MPKNTYYHGIDVGTTFVKSAILDQEGEVRGSSIARTGPDHEASIQSVFQGSLAGAGILEEDLERTTATGFGRQKVDFADSTRTEISCHAAGVFHHVPRSSTIIDIGGQDTKIIRVGEKGELQGFVMNRKCAAGTGAFLEEIAQKLGIPLDELNRLAESSDQKTSLSSFCTVFASTEVLQRIKDGERIEDMIRSAFESIARRIIEMGELGDTLVMSGGVVAHNPVIAVILRELTGTEITIPPIPQFMGALGAALFARRT